jgi:hypothetical protein
MPLLFSLAQPMSKLKQMLLDDFSGQTLSLNEIYERHSVGKPYLKKNYSEALRKLEAEDTITAYSLTRKRKKGTFPDHVKIQFKGGG